MSRSSQNSEEIIETDLGIEFVAYDEIPKSAFGHIFPVWRESTVKLLIQKKTDLSSVNEPVELDFCQFFVKTMANRGLVCGLNI